MRPLQGILPGNLRGNPLISFLVFVFALIGAYEAAGFILEGDMAGLAYVGLAFVVGAFVISMLNNWRRGLYIFVIWLLFEDFARKYLGNNMAIYFAKDFLVAIVYLSFFLAWRRKEVETFRPPFRIAVLVMVWFGFLQVFNPASTHIIYGALGMKLFFYYIPLMFVSYALIDSEIELRKFFFTSLVLMSLIACLGIAQSIIGPTFLNPGTLQEDIRELSTLYRVAPISGVIVYRPNAVFVSNGRYINMLYVAWLMALGLIGYLLLRHKRGRWLAFVTLPIIAAGVVLSGSRGVFLWSVIDVIAIVLAYFWGAPWRQREVMKVLRTFIRVGLGITLAAVILLVTFPEALLNRLAVYSETLSPDSPKSELVHRARDYPLQNLAAAFNYERWPYGYGIGTTALGTQYVARIFGVKPAIVGVESGFGTIIVEMGIGGLTIWLIMTTAIVLSAWRVVRQLRGSPWFPIAFVIFWYTFFLFFPVMLGGIQAYEDFVINAYFWLLIGVLFRLPHMKASAEFAAVEKALQPQQRWAT
jgi:hypothetical protein